MWMNYWAIYKGQKLTKSLRRGEFLSATHAWNCLCRWNTEDWTYTPAKDDEHLKSEFHIVKVCGEDLMPHHQTYCGRA